MSASDHEVEFIPERLSGYASRNHDWRFQGFLPHDSVAVGTVRQGTARQAFIASLCAWQTSGQSNPFGPPAPPEEIFLLIQSRISGRIRPSFDLADADPHLIRPRRLLQPFDLKPGLGTLSHALGTPGAALIGPVIVRYATLGRAMHEDSPMNHHYRTVDKLPTKQLAMQLDIEPKTLYKQCPTIAALRTHRAMFVHPRYKKFSCVDFKRIRYGIMLTELGALELRQSW